MVLESNLIAIATAMAMMMSGAESGPAPATTGSDRRFSKVVSEANITLGGGLALARALGAPVCGDHEIVDGEVELVITVEKDSAYMDLVIDPSTGRFLRQTPVDRSERMHRLAVEAAALSNALVRLEEAVAKALAVEQGFKALSVSVFVDAGQPIAKVELLSGSRHHFVTVDLN